jgi:outer membrane immunogenic protein
MAVSVPSRHARGSE